MNESDTSGDSRELEALFDSIASGIVTASSAEPPAAKAKAASLLQQLREGDGADDSDELQALFDSVRGAQAATAAPGAAAQWQGQDRVFQRVGQMARQLHDTLGQLGYSELLESTVSAIPDARERLNYVATLTEQAACRVLNATDIANPLQPAGMRFLPTGWRSTSSGFWPRRPVPFSNRPCRRRRRQPRHSFSRS